MVGSTASAASKELYTRTAVKRFDGSGANTPIDALREHLRRLDAATSLREITTAAELHLDLDGRTRADSYKFTVAAFKQAAQIVGPGLSKFLPELAGMVSTADDVRDRLVDGCLAIRFWNTLVDLRFPLFQRYRIIRNDTARTIEGFVSQRHQYLENLWLYSEAVEMLATAGQNFEPYAAALTGRQFSLWFRCRTPLLSVQVNAVNWPIYSGCYFTNGEATGTSVRGTAVLFTPRGTCLAPYRKFGRRITHIGRDFMRRIGEMFSAVMQAELPIDKLRTGFEQLSVKSLGYSATSTEDQRKERTKKLVSLLALLGVQKNIALEAVELALVYGRYHGAPTVDWMQVNELYASRTLLDLFVPLLAIARRLDIARREKIEQAAFEIITGRLLL